VTPHVPIDASMRDPRLLGAALGDPASWTTWLIGLRAAAGLPLDEAQRAVFGAIAGNRAPPSRPVRETWVIAGRGAGKSRMAAGTGVHTALLRPHRLARGETGCVLILSPTVAQARVVFGYALGFIEASPALRREIASVTSSEIRLKNDDRRVRRGRLMTAWPNAKESPAYL
jgi:phage terminase large subunit-like protein